MTMKQINDNFRSQYSNYRKAVKDDYLKVQQEYAFYIVL